MDCRHGGGGDAARSLRLGARLHARRVIARLTGELAGHASRDPRLGARAAHGPHATSRRHRPARGSARRARAGARGGRSESSRGRHSPITLWQDTRISDGERYRFLYGSMRELARREPTFALHVHVAVPDPEDAMLAMNRLRSHLPLLLALSANSPFWQGRETGLASARTPHVPGLPQGRASRAPSRDYEDYVEDRSAAALRGVPRADVPVVGRSPAAALGNRRGADHGRPDHDR